MLYTVGKTKEYERYFREQGTPKKAVGGSVWYSRESAERYLHEAGLDKDFSIYGVKAKWEDTEYTGQPFRNLKIEAELVRLEGNK